MSCVRLFGSSFYLATIRRFLEGEIRRSVCIINFKRVFYQFCGQHPFSINFSKGSCGVSVEEGHRFGTILCTIRIPLAVFRRSLKDCDPRTYRLCTPHNQWEKRKKPHHDGGAFFRFAVARGRETITRRPSVLHLGYRPRMRRCRRNHTVPQLLFLLQFRVL